MKKFIGLCVLLCSIFSISDLYGAGVDQRVRKKLDMGNIKYTITKYGDFQIIVKLANGRTQAVLVASDTEKCGDFEIREIHSLGYVYKSPAKLSGSDAKILLERNNRTKIGSWSLLEGGSEEYIAYTVHISANLNSDNLKSMIFYVAESADDLEKEISGRDNW